MKLLRNTVLSILFALIFTTVSVTQSSCTDEDTNEVVMSLCKLFCEINGYPLTPKESAATCSWFVDFAFWGLYGEDDKYSVDMNGNKVMPGTYNVGTDVMATVKDKKTGKLFAGMDGVINIAAIDSIANTMKGSFNFTAFNGPDSLVIKKGSFDMPKK